MSSLQDRRLNQLIEIGDPEHNLNGTTTVVLAKIEEYIREQTDTVKTAEDLLKVSEQDDAEHDSQIEFWDGFRDLQPGIFQEIYTSIVAKYIGLLKEYEKTKNYATYQPAYKTLRLAAREILDLLLERTRNRHNIEELTKQAEIDPLTKLLSRRGLDTFFAQNAPRPDGGYSVIYIDLDNFGRVNKTSGHETGDAALRRFADILHKLERKYPDIGYGRRGGDEHVIAIPGKYERTFAKEMTEHIRTEVENDEMLSELGITTSIGIASLLPQQGNEHDMPDSFYDGSFLVQAADTCMNFAKHEREKNNIVDAYEKIDGNDQGLILWDMAVARTKTSGMKKEYADDINKRRQNLLTKYPELDRREEERGEEKK